ncbi:MAG: tRNA (adenosine(37)-N6)-threonylcarbamoyltransferase complex ATPase subunit type 1 TsaE [Hyphomicrobiales bacterium]
MQWSFELADEAATVRLGEDIAAALGRGDAVLLEGDLGAGKSTLARAIVRAIGDDDSLEVPSPTFTLVQTYETERLTIGHFDLYRLEAPEELDELGFDDALDLGAVLVEWPDRGGNRLPDEAIRITLAIAPGTSLRQATISVPAAAAGRFSRSLAARAFLAENGWGTSRRRHLQGEASARSYERIGEGRRRAVLMNAPRRPDGPVVPRYGKPYSAVARLAEDVRAFVAVGWTLFEAGFSAPALFGIDMTDGFLLLEDLGSDKVVDENGPIAERYAAAVDCLAALHGRRWPNSVLLPDDTRYEVPPYDAAAMTIEVELLIDWYAPHRLGRRLDEAAEEEFRRLWRAVFVRLVAAEDSWVLRDYHSPNLIWLETRVGAGRVGLIDFQDAVVGPAAYDVASLLQDARVTVPPALEAELFERYCAARAKAGPFNATAFAEAYAIMAAQRATKVLGIFARLDKRDGKPAYLAHMPRVSAYLAKALKHPVLQPLAVWYDTHLPEILASGPSGER